MKTVCNQQPAEIMDFYRKGGGGSLALKRPILDVVEEMELEINSWNAYAAVITAKSAPSITSKEFETIYGITKEIANEIGRRAYERK